MIKGYGDKLDKIYKDIRQNNLKEYLKRKNYIEKVHPEILEIDKNISLLSIELIKLKNKNNLNNIKAKLDFLRNKKFKALNSINLPNDYLDIKYTCYECKDTGYILDKKCTCLTKNLSHIYAEESELNTIIKKNNFENFDFSFFSKDNVHGQNLTPNENIKIIYRKILEYIKNFNLIKYNLLFIGECGSGKTFLTHCIAKELLDKGYSVIYKTSVDLMSDLYQYYFSKTIDNNNKIDDLILFECDLLIIDDLGTEPINNFSHSCLFNFINKKLLLNKSLIISTNFTLKHLQETYSDRIFSRLSGEFSILNFFVKSDIRLQKKLRARGNF